MIELLIVVLFLCLTGKLVGLLMKLTWGLIKVVGFILTLLAFPILVLCMIFAGGLALLIPFAMIASAYGLMKLCL